MSVESPGVCAAAATSSTTRCQWILSMSPCSAAVHVVGQLHVTPWHGTGGPTGGARGYASLARGDLLPAQGKRLPVIHHVGPGGTHSCSACAPWCI